MEASAAVTGFVAKKPLDFDPRKVLIDDGNLSRLLTMEEAKARAASHKYIMKEAQTNERNQQLKIQEKEQQDRYSMLQIQYEELMAYQKQVSETQKPGSSVTVQPADTILYNARYTKYQKDLVEYQEFQQAFIMEQQKQALLQKQEKQINKLRLKQQIIAHDAFLNSHNSPPAGKEPKTAAEILSYNKMIRKHALFVPYTKGSGEYLLNFRGL